MHRHEIEIDPKILLVDTISDTKIKKMLQLQPQKAATTPQQHFNPLLDKLQKQLRTKTICYDNKIRMPN